jgi:superfamily II DNA or RNA helicase
MLTEGMDLPSITGVMPLRNLGLTKLIQLIGRALRLHKNDRVNLYSGSIMPGDYKKYVKPYGYLVVPKHLSSIDEYDKMIDTAKIFYSIYRTKAEELVIQEKFISHKPSTLNSVIPFNSKNVKDYVLDHTEINLVNEINLNNFKEEYSKASNKIKFFEDIFK